MQAKTIFKNAADVATLDIFDVIDADFGIGAADIAQQLQQSTASVLQVRIDSAGGSVTDGIAIMNLLKQAPQRVEVNIVGVDASIASIIALAGYVVRMSEGSYFMIHNVRAGLLGTAAELRDAATAADSMEQQIISIYTANAGKRGKLLNGSEEETRQMFAAMVDGETWINAQQAIEIGLADEIAGTEREIAGEAATDMQNFSIKYFNHAPKGYLNRINKMTKETKKGIFARFLDFLSGDAAAKEEIAELAAIEATEQVEEVAEQVETTDDSAEKLAALEAKLEALTAALAAKEETTEEVAEEESESDKIERLANARAMQIIAEKKAAAPAGAGTKTESKKDSKTVNYSKQETAAFNRLATILKEKAGF